jgi:hypothetical protein
MLITVLQMISEYERTQDHVKNQLLISQAIFSASLTTAVWAFDADQLNANLEGILKMPVIVGVKIDNMDKPSVSYCTFSPALPVSLLRHPPCRYLLNYLTLQTINRSK